MRILILDDMTERHKFFKNKLGNQNNMLIHSYSYSEALIELRATPYLFDVLYLDHDLSLEDIMCDPENSRDKNGTDFARLIVKTIDPKKLTKPLKIYLHTMNPFGKVSMLEILVKAGFDVESFELP